jgi:L,D-transpeptidase ErfK/SrfK
MVRALVLALALESMLLAAAASAAEYDLSPDQDVIGQVQVIKARYEDTFVALARAYGLGYEELRSANPHVDAWLPGEGTEIVLPTQYVLPRGQRRRAAALLFSGERARQGHHPPD